MEAWGILYTTYTAVKTDNPVKMNNDSKEDTADKADSPTYIV